MHQRRHFNHGTSTPHSLNLKLGSSYTYLSLPAVISNYNRSRVVAGCCKNTASNGQKHRSEMFHYSTTSQPSSLISRRHVHYRRHIKASRMEAGTNDSLDVSRTPRKGLCMMRVNRADDKNMRCISHRTMIRGTEQKQCGNLTQH